MLFISHRTADKQFALNLLERAQQRGYEERQLFLDSDEQSGIKIETKWEQVLYERIKDCWAMVV